MKNIYPFSLVVFLGLWVLGVYWSGANLGTFASVAAAVIVLGVSFVLCLSCFSPAEMGCAFRAALRREGSSASSLERALLFFRALTLYLLLAGLMALLVGLIIVLWSAGDGGVASEGLAASLVPILYSLLLIAGVALPFRIGVTRRLQELQRPTD